MPTYIYRTTRNGHDYADATGVMLFPQISPDGTRVAWKNHADGHALVLTLATGQTQDFGPTLGNAAVVWGDDGSLWVEPESAGGYGLTRYLPDGTQADFDLRTIYPTLLPAALGVHHINAANIPILPNDPSVAHAFVHGIECWQLDYDVDGTVVALSNGGGPAGCCVKISPDGTAVMWVPQPGQDIQVSPFISYGRVAISGFDTPDPGAVPWVPWTGPYVPPQPQPPSSGDIALPVLLISLPAAFVGCTDGTSARPGNAEWSPSSYDDELDRPVGEGVDYAATVASRDLLIAKWSTEAAAGGLPALDRTILWAKQRKVAVEIHVDSPSHRLFAMEARQRVLDAGLVPVLCAHAVQNADDFEADARAFSSLGKFGITLNFIAANKDPEKFKSCILRANGLHRELQPVVVWFARWQQAGPQMKAYCAEYCRLTPTPVKRPHEQGTQTPVPPIDIPPVTGPIMPNADPPVPKRHKRFRPS